MKLFSAKISQTDKAYLFWERNSLTIELYNLNITNQKLEYFHYNSCTKKWKFCAMPNEYKYINCNFYYNQIDEFNFLTHINEL